MVASANIIAGIIGGKATDDKLTILCCSVAADGCKDMQGKIRGTLNFLRHHSTLLHEVNH
jgi:hypothetical protein